MKLTANFIFRVLGIVGFIYSLGSIIAYPLSYHFDEADLFFIYFHAFLSIIYIWLLTLDWHDDKPIFTKESKETFNEQKEDISTK